MMKVYLCGPINGCSDTECNDWRNEIKQHFSECINPMRRDYRGVEKVAYREIVELDKRDIRSADIVLVNYVKPSVGTSMEIYYAWSLGVPVVLLCAKTEILSPWLIYHTTAIVHSVTDAINKIRTIFE